MNRPSLIARSVEPILAVRDVRAAVEEYVDVLGFEHPWAWGDPPTHGGVVCGKAGVQFSLAPQLADLSAGQSIYFFVDEVDLWYARHATAGAVIATPITDQPWGMREYTVRDRTGYLLRFGAAASSVGPPRTATPSDLAVEPRLPTEREYIDLIDAVGWRGFTAVNQTRRILAGALHGVVAIADGRTVGAGLVLGDRVSFYYLKDIMVDPAYQHRGIGSAIVQSLIDWIEQNASDQALIGLYTGRNLDGFYSKWGFRGGDTALWGMTRRAKRG